jgi:TonB family protein
MRRIFSLVVILAFASVVASDAFAQSGRIRRNDAPKEERAQEPARKDEAKNGAKDNVGAQDEGKDKAQDEAQADDDKPLTGKTVTERAVIKAKPNPGYPRGARRYGVEGIVKLRIILGADGRVSDKMEVLEGLPHGITEEALKAARRIVFEPARKDGRPVAQYVTVIYHFNLH